MTEQDVLYQAERSLRKRGLKIDKRSPAMLDDRAWFYCCHNKYWDFLFKITIHPNGEPNPLGVLSIEEEIDRLPR